MTCERCADRGMCCRYIELPLARPLTEDERKWVELHPGLSIRGSVLHLDISCSALTADGLCSLFGTDERPLMCAVWPDDLEQVPQGCAFAERLALV